jgi:hypothetical protein
MSITNYAIEVYLNNSTITAPEHGFQSGVLRVITGRPGYDGHTVVPTYADGEIDINGESFYIKNDNWNNSNVYYQDFLLKDGIDGNAIRSIDVTSGGSYGNDSSFGFKLRGDKVAGSYFWEFCATNKVVLSNAIVIFYVVINNVFYQQWRGRVSNNPATEVDFEFQCKDDATTIHKILPPDIIQIIKTTVSGVSTDLVSSTNTNTQTLDGVTLQPDQSMTEVTVPVVFGDVAFSPIIKTNDQNVCVVLDVADQGYGEDITEQYATSYHIANPGDVTFYSRIPYTSYVDIVTNSTLHKFIDDDPQLVGKYLIVTAGTNADTEIAYKIISNDRTGPDSVISVYQVAVTRVYLGSQLAASENLLVSESQFNSNVIGASPDGYAFYLGHLSNPYAGPNTWYFKVSDFKVETEISTLSTQIQTNNSGKLTLYSWDDNSKTYVDISSLVTIASSGSSLSVVSNIVGVDGKAQLIEPINFEIQEIGIRKDYINPADYPHAPRYPTNILKYTVDVADFDFLTNKVRNTPGLLFDLGGMFIGGNIFIYTRYVLSPIINSYDRILYLVDCDFQCSSPTSFTLSGLVYTPFSYQDFASSPFTLICSGNPSNVFGLPSGTTTQINLISNNFYPVDPAIADPTSLSLFLKDSGGGSGKPFNWFYDFGNVTNGNKDAIVSRFNHLLQTMMGFTFVGVFAQLKVYIKQITLLGIRSIDTTTGDLFSKVGGELTGPTTGPTAGDNNHETNDVYHTIMHIVEDYDGIPDALIDYGNLPSTRGLWHVGRTVTDQQNSLNYLNEIASQSFIGIFGNRKGQRAFNAWLGGTSAPNTTFTPTVGSGKTGTHDSALVPEESISGFEKTDFSQIYNSYQLKYNYDAGLKDYNRYINVTKVNETAFPDSTSNWQTYVTGLPSTNWSDASSVWTLCSKSYQDNHVTQLATSQINELPWYTDDSVYDPNTSNGTGVTSSAWKFLTNLAYWTTRQKDIVTYNIPIDSSTCATELLDCINFADDVYTDGSSRTGWVTSIEVDAVNNQYILQAVLQSADMVASGDTLPDGLDERPDSENYVDSLDETTINTDSLTE